MDGTIMEAWKFGGSIFGCEADIGRAITVFERRLTERRSMGRPQVPFTVISAFAQVTNVLDEAAESSRKADKKGVSYRVDSLIRRHRDILRFLGLRILEDEVMELFEEIRKLSPNGNFLRFKDEVLSRGERASAPIFTAALNKYGLRATLIDAREVVVTDDNYTNAEPDWRVTGEKARSLILPIAEEGIVPVMAGYIGRSKTGATTTLGREASDLTLTGVGACIGVRETHKWTNVDGIYDKDPKKHRDAKVIEYLTFEQADEFARTKNMIHPKTIEPLMEKRIPLSIWNIGNPDRPGTRISD